MERLSHVITAAVEAGDWIPISLVSGGPLISHLFYADDLILFARASVDQAEVISKCLEVFCNASGQSVSRDKSLIFCSKNTDRNTSRLVAARLGIPLTQNLGRYLGVPVLHGRTSSATYQCILDRLDKKLSGWKAKSLSLAGRVTLALSTLGAIPSYAMQTSVLPIYTCEAIDKRIRDFVWGSTPEERKVHLISWEQICKPKAKGGLGLRLARHLNMAYMTKLAFLFFQNPNLLWVQVLHTKYFRAVNGELRPRNRSSQSSLWRGISSAWQIMLEGARAGIQNGMETRFWTTRWLDSGIKIVDKVVRNHEEIEIEAAVCEFTTDSGNWDTEKLRHFLDDDTIGEIMGMMPPNSDRGEDSWVWSGESNGKFSIRSAYDLIVKPANPNPDAQWELVWKWKGPARIQHFLWLVMHDRLLTNLERKRRHLSADSRCSRCGNSEESVTHILRDCPAAASVWDELGYSRQDQIRANLPLLDWCVVLLKNHDSLKLGITCWYLWKSRNEWIFSNLNNSAATTAAKINSWSQTVQAAFVSSPKHVKINPDRDRVDIAWEPGPPGWVVLNTDGSVSAQSGRAAAGGLIRNEAGFCLSAFAINLGKCSITRAELRGAITGLEHAWEAGHRRVAVQMDSRVALDLLWATGVQTHQHAGEILALRSLISRDWEVSFSHVYREGNHAADFLANTGHSLPFGFHVFPTTDCNLGYFLRRDCMGISEPRIITNE
ncbi:Putative ribonuclease H protein At1g65750 [Linum perenne]